MNEEFYEVKRPKSINTGKTVYVSVPGSKSITNRALLLAAMSDGRSRLGGCLSSDDSRHFLECIKALGFPVSESGGEDGDIEITGFGGEIPRKKAELYVGSAGTAARFLAAMLAFSDGEYTLNSSEQMKKRPMQPLIDTLRSAGARVECLEEEGHFPLFIAGTGRENAPDSFTVDIGKSSQFLSALLIAAGTLGKKTRILVEGSHGLSYAELTVKMMKSFGVAAESENNGGLSYLVSGYGYRAADYGIEPDMSAAAYFYALAAVLGARVCVNGARRDMLQGDTRFFDVLEKTGCEISETEKGVVVRGPEGGKLKGGFTVDMSSFSDQALTLAAIAPFADAPVTVVGVGHIRLQECDRINAITQNLSALGIKADGREDGFTVYNGVPSGCDIQTFDDHRAAMSFALTGLRADGVRILDPLCCKKTFPRYFEVLERTLRELSAEY